MAAARDPANGQQSCSSWHGQPAARFRAMRPCPRVLKARATDEGLAAFHEAGSDVESWFRAAELKYRACKTDHPGPDALPADLRLTTARLRRLAAPATTLWPNITCASRQPASSVPVPPEDEKTPETMRTHER